MGQRALCHAYKACGLNTCHPFGFNEASRLRSESRTALLASKRAIDHDARSRRDELLDAAALRKKREAEAEAHKQRATCVFSVPCPENYVNS